MSILPTKSHLLVSILISFRLHFTFDYCISILCTFSVSLFHSWTSSDTSSGRFVYFRDHGDRRSVRTCASPSSHSLYAVFVVLVFTVCLLVCGIVFIQVSQIFQSFSDYNPWTSSLGSLSMSWYDNYLRSTLRDELAYSGRSNLPRFQRGSFFYPFRDVELLLFLIYEWCETVLSRLDYIGLVYSVIRYETDLSYPG